MRKLAQQTAAVLCLLFISQTLTPALRAQPVDQARQPHVVIVVGTHHYSPQLSMPKFAKRLEQYGFRTSVVAPPGDPEKNKNGVGIPGLEALQDADLAIFFLRFLTLESDQLQHVLDYVEAGRPVIGLRTSTHAFAYAEDHPLASWNDGFGRDVLGSKYFIHLQGQTIVEHLGRARGHVVLNQVASKFVDPGTLYKVELPDDAQVLLMGTGRARKPGTVTNAFGTHELEAEMTWPVAWTWRNKWGGRVFGTTLGHPKSFELDAVNNLLVNAVHWLLDRPVNASADRLGIERSNRRLRRPVGLLTDHDPEVERRSFQLLPGFEVNLWAAEPMLVNPIHMTWDAQGRLWCCCSTSYPQLRPGEEPNDQVIVLEDTDGDGRADKSTVFADGLLVPTGLELGDGGVYVGSAPDLLFLKDTDGDLKADLRQIVLTGFATEDNHHSISAWRWGPGGWLYFQEGTFMHSQVETPHGPVRLENGGIFQFRPRDMRLRVYADYRASNPWGHMFDRWGEDILIDNPQLYFTSPLTANSRAKLAYTNSGKGSSKNCGGEFVSGRHLPPEFAGEIWTNQYKAHRVARFKVTEDGAGVAIKEQPPLMTSDSPYFRPVDLKIGPDGAAYVLDWYNPLIGHMQHSFRDERRDTTHGRVWRIRYRPRPLVDPPRLVGQPLNQVVDHLRDAEGWTRHQVKRVLAEREPDQAADTLAAFVSGLDEDDPDFEHQRLEALWSYQTIGVVNEPLLREVLSSEDHRARTAGLRVLRDWLDEIDQRETRLARPSLAASPDSSLLLPVSLQLLEAAINDAHPRVRLEAVLTLSFVPDARSITIATRALEQPTDRYIEHALRLAVDALAPVWLPAYRQGRLTFASESEQNFALSNVLSNESVTALIALLNSGGVRASQVVAPAAAIAQSATSKQLEPLVLTLFEHTREYASRGREASEPAAIAIILGALDRAARERQIVPESGVKLLDRTFAIPDAQVQAAAARLAGSWNSSQHAPRLQNLVRSDQQPVAVRIAAAESLGRLGTKSQLAFLDQLANAAGANDNSTFGVVGLAEHDLAAAAVLAANVLAQPALPQGHPATLVDAFISRKGGADLLTEALRNHPPHPSTAAGIIQHFFNTGVTHEGLTRAFGGGVPRGSLEDQLLAEDVFKLASDAQRLGDPARGETIFRRTALACYQCHSIGGAGGVIGPELGTIGSSSPPDYIVDALLRPSKVIKEFYEAVVIVTDQGRVINGILRFKDNQKIVVRDPNRGGREISIPMAEVEQVAAGPSLMPQGLANRLASRYEFLDLASFIMQLGRPGPYAASTRQLVRRWRVHRFQDNGQPFDPAALATLSAGDLSYTSVSGRLSLEPAAAAGQFLVAIAEVEVSRSGNVLLRTNVEPSAALFVDGRPVMPASETKLLLTRGRVQLALVAAPARPLESVEVELVDLPGSPASYKLVNNSD